MKIKEVTSEYIEFTDGSRITYDHVRDCCEINYADFEQIEESAFDEEFKQPLIIETIKGRGFRFGSIGFCSNMFFIPCYSEQNGYYTSELDIYYDGLFATRTDCEERIF